jgi:quercetin dioxygenase-like cupin family protein
MHGIRTTNLLLTLSLAAVLPATSVLSQDSPLPEGFETEPVLRTTETRDGDPLEWPAGRPEIVSVIGTIEPGGQTPLHQHPVPVFVYIMEGEVELRTEGDEPHTYRAGDAYIESLNRDHQLFNIGDTPVRALVVFVAEEGEPTTVAAE